jgi:hypothetical protein
MMHPLEQELEMIIAAYKNGDISQEEKDYLVAEIRDIRAAQECADNEVMFRMVVSACNIALSVV